MNIHKRISELVEEFQVTIRGGAKTDPGSSGAATAGATGDKQPVDNKPLERKMGAREREAYAKFTDAASAGGRAITSHEFAALERFRKMDELDKAYVKKKGEKK